MTDEELIEHARKHAALPAPPMTHAIWVLGARDALKVLAHTLEERNRQVAALSNYTAHASSCAYIVWLKLGGYDVPGGERVPQPDCTCGLAAALAEPEALTEEHEA